MYIAGKLYTHMKILTRVVMEHDSPKMKVCNNIELLVEDEGVITSGEGLWYARLPHSAITTLDIAK